VISVNWGWTLADLSGMLRYPDKKIIAGVDSCQRLSGISLKFAAFDQMMTEKPQIANVVLIQKGIRAGLRVADEEITSKDVTAMADRINTKIRRTQFHTSNANAKFIDYVEVASMSIYERVALWLVADVFMLTAIREGLNLRPLEYMYARKKAPYAGVVVVSEFTACASLLSGSLKINPYNTQDVSDTLLKALTMKKDEASRRHQRDLPFLETHPSAQWTKEILSDLNYIRDAAALIKNNQRQQLGYPKLLDSALYTRCYEQTVGTPLQDKGSRLFIFDYGGTIVRKENFEVYMKQAAFSISVRGPTEAMYNALRRLSEDPRNEIVVMTGLTRERFGDAFAGCDNITVATSNGLVHSWGKRLAPIELPNNNSIRHEDCSFGGRAWDIMDFSHIDWPAVRAIAEPIMVRFTYRTNGSVISPRVLSIGWSYFGADPDWGEAQSKNISVELEAALAMHDVKIVSHITGVIEIVPRGLHKGVMVTEVMRRVVHMRGGRYPQFLSVFGNDKNDDMMYCTASKLIGEAASGGGAKEDATVGSESAVKDMVAFSVNVGCRPSPAELYVSNGQVMSNVYNYCFDRNVIVICGNRIWSPYCVHCQSLGPLLLVIIRENAPSRSSMWSYQLHFVIGTVVDK
jgi:trehalose 6-phosphate synthase/phosphatase